MPETLVTVEQAMKFYGLGSLEDLERIVVEYEIDADFDGEGELTAVDVEGPQAREALFEEHRRVAGHRPDDEEAHQAALREMESQRKAAKTRRSKKRSKIERRVAARKGQTKKRRLFRRAKSR